MSFRRSWDNEAYERKAAERAANGDSSSTGVEETKPKLVSSDRVEYQEADDDAELAFNSHNALLKARDGSVLAHLEKSVGRVDVVRPKEGQRGPGFKCEVCDMTYSDSASYLRHVNSAQHQRALGFSMKVKKAGIDQVRQRLESLKRKKEVTGNGLNNGKIKRVEDIEVLEQLEEQEQKIEEREEGDANEGEGVSVIEDCSNTDGDGDNESDKGDEGDEDEMAAIIGFSGFGSSKKK
jgi:U4/U6.U5 tri-snRNP component SNU23